jgi:hypothetical protein
MSDTTIGHVAQLLQLAMLTGTDIIDHFRAVQFTIDNVTGTINLDPAYAENFNGNLEKMMTELREADHSADADEATAE